MARFLPEMVSIHPTTPQDANADRKHTNVRAPSTPSERRATVQTRLASLLTGQTRRGYTPEKLLAFESYARETPLWRMVFVVAATPLPSLLTLLVPPLFPLKDPTRGILENPGFCGHFVLVMGTTVFGAIIQGRAVTQLPHRELTTTEILTVSLLSSTLLLGVTIALATAWRFPVPFTWALDFVPWVLCLVCANLLVLRRRLWAGGLTRPALVFFPSFVVQISQVLIYPAFFAAFNAVSTVHQVLLTLCFPVIKYYVKKILRVASWGLDDYSEEVAVSGVEICAAMYQSQIMQNTPSVVATVIIIGVDVVQGIASVKLFMDKSNPVVPRHEIVAKGIELLQAKKAKAVAKEADGSADHTRKAKGTWISSPGAVYPQVHVGEATLGGDEVAFAETPLVNHALEIMHTAESILLVEYFEVIIPVVNGVYLAIAAQMDSARYNPNVREFYHRQDRLKDAMASLALYAMLQGLSVVAMNLVMWYRFRISAVAHLSFILERHQWSLQGKLFSWLAVFFNFTVLHYGTDFNFKFDFSMPTD